MPHPTHYRSFRTHNGVCVCGWKKAGMCCWQFCPVLSIQMVAGVNQCIYVGRLAQALCVHCLEFAGRCTAQFFADCHTNTVLWMCSDRLSIGPTKASAFAGWGCYPCVSLAAAATVISLHIFASRVCLQLLQPARHCIWSYWAFSDHILFPFCRWLYAWHLWNPVGSHLNAALSENLWYYPVKVTKTTNCLLFDVFDKLVVFFLVISVLPENYFCIVGTPLPHFFILSDSHLNWAVVEVAQKIPNRTKCISQQPCEIVMPKFPHWYWRACYNFENF